MVGGGSGEEGRLSTGQVRPALRLVRDPQEVAASEREDHAAEMRKTVSDLAVSLGVPWLTK